MEWKTKMKEHSKQYNDRSDLYYTRQQVNQNADVFLFHLAIEVCVRARLTLAQHIKVGVVFTDSRLLIF